MSHDLNSHRCRSVLCVVTTQVAVSTSAAVSGASAHGAIPEVDVTSTSMTVRICADLVSTAESALTVRRRSHAAANQVSAVLYVSSVRLTDADTARDLTVSTTPSASPRTRRLWGLYRLSWTVVRRRV